MKTFQTILTMHTMKIITKKLSKKEERMLKNRNLILGFTFIMFMILSTNLIADGTEPTGNPRQVSTLDHLLWISTNSSSWDYDFIQMADIDASATSGWNSDVGFSPIGNVTTPFTGSYDGGGHTIDNLFIYRYSYDYIGLFGCTDGANIENLGVTNCDVTGRDCVGGLVGMNYNLATISKCYSTGEVNGYWNGDYVGGLAGYNNGTISNCYSTVSGINFVGGLVGYHYSTISNSYSTGTVIGVNTIGGFIGLSYGTCTNSFWDKETSETTIGIGGGFPVTQPIGKTTDQMKTGHFSGWDWTNTWERIGYNYPRLIDNPDPTLPVVL